MARKPIDPSLLGKTVKAKAKNDGKTITVTATASVPVPDTITGIKHRLFATYIQDVQERGIETLFETTLDDDGKPIFPKYISINTAKKWAIDGNWSRLRHEALIDLEIRTFEVLKDQILKQRIKETRDLWDVREALIQHLGPKRDRKTGQVIIHGPGSDLEGLPVLHHDVKGGYTKLLEAFLKLDERITERRNETVKHMGAVIDDAKGFDPDAQPLPVPEDSPEKDLVRRLSYTPEQMRKMAHELLRKTSMHVDDEDEEEDADVEEVIDV